MLVYKYEFEAFYLWKCSKKECSFLFQVWIVEVSLVQIQGFTILGQSRKLYKLDIRLSSGGMLYHFNLCV